MPCEDEFSCRTPKGTGEVAQRFSFTGTIGDAGIAWPRELAIDQDGKRFFELTLSSFAAETGSAS